MILVVRSSVSRRKREIETEGDKYRYKQNIDRTRFQIGYKLALDVLIECMFWSRRPDAVTTMTTSVLGN